MSLLPGVPNVGPAPVNPTIKVSGKASLGGPAGIAKVAQTAGKPGNTEHIGSVVGRTGKGISSLGGGSSLAHSASQYAKMPGAGAIMGGEIAGAGGVDPTKHAGATIVRGGAMRSHLRTGGIGPGNMGAPGANSPDATGDPGASSPSFTSPSSGDTE